MQAVNDPNGWPDPQRPGVPLNPERDYTPHWLARGDEDPEAWTWTGDGWNPPGSELYHEVADVIAKDRRYLGRCLTPAEVDARVAEARRDALREAAGIARVHAAAAKRCSEEADVIHRIRSEYLAKSFALNTAADDIEAAILARAEGKP
jgi:hypothetical protein